jgi:hypothetical protein
LGAVCNHDRLSVWPAGKTAAKGELGGSKMTRRGPLLTLGAIVVFGVILLLANTTAAPPPAAAAHAAAAPRALSHALFVGRSSDDTVTVAIAVNGRKAAAHLHAPGGEEDALQGKVTGTQLALSGSDGVRMTGQISGTAVFGTVTTTGESVPFSALEASVKAVYAGRSSGGEVSLAVDTDGSKAAGYVCNGKTIEAWMQGTVSGNKVTLTGSNGATLTASLSGLAMFGTVTPKAGDSLPFSAELAPHPAGVFQARILIDGLATRIGWAVLPDGTQAGVAVAGNTDSPAPALNLATFTFTDGGASFKAAPVAGDDTVVSP